MRQGSWVAEIIERLVVGPLAESPDGGVVFVFGLATFVYAAGDETGRRLAAVQLVTSRVAAAGEVAAAFGVSGVTLWRWGQDFAHAVRSPGLGASVVYYGTSPAPARLASVRAPVLGLYGSDDARVDATVPPADSAMKALGKTYRPIFYEGAGHGFLRQQDGRERKNLAAATAAWPETISWFRTHLGR